MPTEPGDRINHHGIASGFEEKGVTKLGLVVPNYYYGAGGGRRLLHRMAASERRYAEETIEEAIQDCRERKRSSLPQPDV